MIELIEKMHLGHFEYLPRILKFPIMHHQELSVIHCGLGSSMFNIVFGGIKAPTKEKVDTVIRLFKQQPFAWWIPPTQTNIGLKETLLDLGFIKESEEHAMLCDLQTYSPLPLTTNLNIRQVTNRKALDDFISILSVYDSTANTFYQALEAQSFANLSEKLFVGYVEQTAVVIGILFTQEQTSSVFTLITDENSRGRGYGSDMMKHLMNFAKRSDYLRMTLSASSEAGYKIYERLGFKCLGAFDCYEHPGTL